MGKEEKPKMKSERDRYVYSQQVEAYRQRDAKEKRTLADQTKKDINKLESYFNTNNNYLAIFKTDPQKTNAGAIQVENLVDAKMNANYEYYNKCHRDRWFHLNKTQKNDNPNIVPITTSQQIGWGQPIDDTKFQFGKKNMISAEGNSLNKNLMEYKKEEKNNAKWIY